MEIAPLKKYIINDLGKKIPSNLSYHGLEHTLAVLRVCTESVQRYAIPPKEAFLLQTAALFHDMGFTIQYENHEENSIKIAQEVLPTWGFSAEQIQQISKIILSTKIPQKPQSLLEKIICDADLDYLGTELFYPIGNLLFRELKTYGKITTKQEWDKLQIKFLKSHSYHTPFAQKYREPHKQKHLKELIKKVDSNDIIYNT